MYDSNKSQQISKTELLPENKTAKLFIKDLIEELEKQLNSLQIEQKEYDNLIREKEQELLETEQRKVQNLELFSPIYSKAYDISDIKSEMDHMKHKRIELGYDQEQLQKKIKKYRNVVQCIENNNSFSFHNKLCKEDYLYKNRNENGINILETQEKERQRIARDLHDSTVQNLTSLVHKTELCSKLIDIDIVRAKLELVTMSNTIKTVINEMRDIIYNLKPMSLDDLGLVITVERFAKHIMDVNDIKVEINSNKEKKDVLPVINITLFRVIQEACRNVIKHANANLIIIDITYYEQGISVIIKDNGIGFDVSKQETGTKQSSNFGLSIMRERIALLSGTVEIKSISKKGTIVTIYTPLTICEGDKNEQTD